MAGKTGSAGRRSRVLLLHYSQSGRTRALAESFSSPLRDDPDIELVERVLQPQPGFPFPWSFFAFLDAFPETVQLDPPPLAPLDLDDEHDFDLVILCYTVWFLSPAPPIAAFLESADARRILAGTPTVTLINCRNMWMQAHEIVSMKLADLGARHCDNVVYTDTGPSSLTFITTPRWMFTGRRDRFLGMPSAGVGDAAIAGASRFGRAIVEALHAGGVNGSQPLLSGLRAVTVDARLLDSERIGRRSFLIWSRLLRRLGPPGAAARRPALLIYSVLLIAMIVTIVPLSMLIRRLLRPFQKRRMQAIHARYAGPSGDGDARMERFSG